MARRKWDLNTIQRVLDGDDNPFVQIGYTGEQQFRKVGDEWTDPKGITWKKTENGVVRVNKQMDAIRELIRPRCSSCNMDINLFGTKEDKKIFASTGKCYDCLVLEEDVLRVTGKFDRYEEEKVRRNQRAKLKELYQYTLESIEHLKKGDVKVQMVTSSGDIVTWKQDDVSEMIKVAEKDAQLMKEDLDKLDDIILKFEKSKYEIDAAS
jgi:hypothetical protein